MDLVTNQTLIHFLHIDLDPIYVNRFALWIAPTHQQNRKPRKSFDTIYCGAYDQDKLETSGISLQSMWRHFQLIAD